MRPAALLAGTALLAACQAPLPPMYTWSGYDKVVHDTRWSPGAMPLEAQIAALEDDRNTARIHELKLPPGWRVHLGMLYGMAGDTGRARELLLEEKTVFPESGRLVDVLVGGLGPRGTAK